MVILGALVQSHDTVKIVELWHSPSNMARQKEWLSKSGAVHKRGLSAFTTKNASSVDIPHRSGLHLACVLPEQLRGISNANGCLALSHCREIKISVRGNWCNAIAECLSTGLLEHWDWAYCWWRLFHPFFENCERPKLQFKHYVFLRVCPLCAVFFCCSSLLRCQLFVFWRFGICILGFVITHLLLLH